MTQRRAISWLALTVIAVTAFLFSGNESRRLPGVNERAQSRAWGELPVYFVENRGQLPSDVAFHIEGAKQHITFHRGGLTFLFADHPVRPEAISVAFPSSKSAHGGGTTLRFVNPNPDSWPIGRRRSASKFQFYLGSRDRWRENVPAYGEIVYGNLWPGIDLAYTTLFGNLKATFTVHPVSDTKKIRFAYDGAELSLLENGRLEIRTTAGSFEDAAPSAYQRIGGEQREVPVSFELISAGSRAVKRSGTVRDAPLEGRGAKELSERRLGESPSFHSRSVSATQYGFRLGDYDPTKPLIIDPSVVVYAGYLGGFRDDEGTGIAVDAEGAAYIVGRSNSLRAAPPEGGAPPTDAFVIKINAAGTELAYAVRIGGDEEDRGLDIAVDDDGNAYITGSTSSSEASFPLKDGLDMTFAGGFRDAFVLKLDPAGLLAYSSYLGGSEADEGLGIAVDGERAVYVSGETRSTETDDFPLAVGPDLTHNGSSDAFITKVNPAGDAIVFSGYLGGASRETAIDVAVDRQGNAYLTGEVFSDEVTFPVAIGPGLSFSSGLRDAYVAKVRADGGGFDYVGYVGGASDDFANGIAVDSAGHAYLVGTTFSTEETFPVKVGPSLVLVAANDAFVAKVSPSGADLIFAGYIGGFGTDIGRGIAIDKHRDLYVTGRTLSVEVGFPVLIGPDLDFNGGAGDGFLAKVRSDGTGLIQAGYIGGFDADEGTAIAVDREGNAYVAGSTFSTEFRGFPATAAPAPQSFGGSDAFVAKISTEALDRPFEVAGNGVLNAATSVQFPDPLHPTAPGSIVSIFGSFAWISESAAGTPLPGELGDVTVTFDGIPAPLFAVVRGDDFNPPLGFDQINAQMPWAVDTADGTASVVVTHDGMSTAPRDVQVASVSPGIFTFQFGTGPAIVQNLNFQGDDVINGSIAQAADSIPGVITQAAPVGGIVIVFANGLGDVDLAVSDGVPAGPDLRRVTGDIRLFIGGVEAEIIDAAVLHPTLVALNQLNAFVPNVEPGDEVSIQIEANGILSRPDVFIAVREAVK